MAGLLRRLNAIPKPILFALYGALGGLFAAGLLAEPLFRLLKPPPPLVVAPPPLAMSASASVAVAQGGSNEFRLALLRSDCPGPLGVKLDGVPAGVTIETPELPGDQSDAAIRLTADRDAKSGEYPLTLRVAGGPTELTAPVLLTVREFPKPPAVLRLVASPTAVVSQGGSNGFFVKLARDFFSGPIAIGPDKLPDGVTLPALTIPADKSDAELVVSVDRDALPGDFPLLLTGKLIDGTVTGRAELKLTIKRHIRPSVDVLFVVDTTGSMTRAIVGVSRGVQEFARNLGAAELDARVGFISFKDRFAGHEAEVLKFDGETFTTDVEAFSLAVGKLKAGSPGNTTPEESTLDALVLGAKQPFREGATKVIIVVTDEPPLVPDKDTKTIAEAIDKLAKAGIHQIHTIVPARDRKVYEPFRSQPFKGEFFDLADAARDAGAFTTKILPGVSQTIVATTIASRPPDSLDVAKEPAPPVMATAPPVPPSPAAPAPPPLRAVQSHQEFAAGSTGQLVAAISVATGALALGIALALTLGQNLYLRSSLGSPLGLLKGAAGGMLAGLLGGAAGQLVFLAATGGGELLFRVVGWSVLGALIGLGMTLFVPNLRALLGLAGGLVGGVCGALGFVGLAGVLPGSDGELAGRVLGGGVLGFALGLMLALAERAFRSAWLEVRYGRVETRQVNLGSTAVTIGGDAQQAMVYAAGAAPVACRIWLEHGTIIRQDAASGAKTGVRPGEEWRVGNVTVKLHVSGKQAAAAMPAPPPPPPKPRVAAAMAKPAPPPPRPQGVVKPPPPPPQRK